MSEKKLLYAASTAGHLASFHRPYIKRLAEKGWIVHAAAGGPDPALEGAAEYWPLPFEKTMFSAKNLKAARQASKLIRLEGYSLVILNTSLAAFFVRLGIMTLPRPARPRVVNVVHGYLFDQDTPFPRRTLLLMAEKLTARVTDRVAVMNRRDEAIAKKHRLSAGDIVFTHGMGVDTKRFFQPEPEEKEAARRALGLEDSGPVLVYAAEFSPRKNQSLLIRAMCGWRPDARLALPGRGALLEDCRALAADMGVAGRVLFPGFVTEIETWFRAADICVSSSRSEGLPLNVLEAMACGVPVIATAVKGHEDLVSPGENGLLYAREDGASFIRAADSLLALDEYDRSRLSAGAENTAKKYSAAAVFEEMLAAMELETSDA